MRTYRPFLTRLRACLAIAVSSWLITLLGLAVPAEASTRRLAHSHLRIGRFTASQIVGYRPDQIRHAYGLNRIPEHGLDRTIAIVDAYDDPSIATDLAVFSRTFSLPVPNGLPGTPSCTVQAGPHPCFQKIGTKRKNAGWAQETSLDVEWAHGIADSADILLVETADPSMDNLLAGIDTAVAQGAAVVSMSWGGPESKDETRYDSHFSHAGVSFVASAGDSGSTASYPAASPNVIGVGGSTLRLNSSGNRQSETAWSGSGGAASRYEPAAAYQKAADRFGGGRGIPDVAYNADPSTGFAVYDSAAYQGQSGWFEVGGTSAGAPQWAALIAIADQGHAAISSPVPFYKAGGYFDITAGSNGRCGSHCTAGSGYDLVTGLGSPQADTLIPALRR